MNILRTDSDNSDFQSLVALLDQDLALRDGDDHAFYAQFNKVDKIKHAVVAFWETLPVGCGAIRAYASGTMELKRMFVLPEYRGKGIARTVLSALEIWSIELGYHHIILETGKKQPEAIRLYQTSGYVVTPNYGPYAQVENSICMEKKMV
ncbi:MAG: GNAT family N-acetyltransferase [Saprospiraceae bacterium]